MSSAGSSKPRVETAHTADLDPGTLRRVRELLDGIFQADMTEHAWDHLLGGMHVLVWEAEHLVAHGSVIQRRLLHGERTLRAGYVEGVGVRADRRGRGYAAATMDVLERYIRDAYDLGALGASEMGAGLYAARGWRHWRGRTWALTPTGRVRTEGEDADVYVLEGGPALDLDGDLMCEWREGWVW